MSTTTFPRPTAGPLSPPDVGRRSRASDERERPCEHLVVELRRFRHEIGVRISCPKQCGSRIFAVVGGFGITLHRHGADAAAIVGELDVRDGAS
jgi:hypothetical protein